MLGRVPVLRRRKHDVDTTAAKRPIHQALKAARLVAANRYAASAAIPQTSRQPATPTIHQQRHHSLIPLLSPAQLPHEGNVKQQPTIDPGSPGRARGSNPRPMDHQQWMLDNSCHHPSLLVGQVVSPLNMSEGETMIPVVNNTKSARPSRAADWCLVVCSRDFCLL